MVDAVIRTEPADLDQRRRSHDVLGRVLDRTSPVDLDQASTPRGFTFTDAKRVEPESTITDLGRLSAEAVVKQWEVAATAVEDMGNDVRKRIGDLRDAMAECDADLKHLAEVAASIREKGKLARLQIEDAARLSDDIRATCDAFRKKLGAS